MVTSSQLITMYLAFCTTIVFNLVIIWWMVLSFSHLPIRGIGPVLARCVFHLQKLKEMIHALEISQGSTKLQEPKNSNKLDEFAFFVIATPPTHTRSTIVLHPLLAHKRSFFAYLLSIDMKYCPIAQSSHAALHLCLLAYFCKLSNLGTKIFSCPSISP